MIVKTADVVQSGNVQITRNRYSLRVKEAVAGKSKSSGNDMITLNCEIYAPAVLETDAGKFSIDGVRLTHYLTLSEAALPRFLDFCKRVNIPVPAELDTENVDVTPFQGLKFDAILDSKERELRQRPAPGQKVGDPIVDDNGNPIKSGWDVKLIEVLGLAAS
tara:strand:+ start:7857 stop:8342 length:486 start_codon:yes stop_codon:yes gene_type:complete